MSQRQILVLIGVAIIILPWLGVPMFWKSILFVLIGLGLVYVAFKGNWKSHTHVDTFSESYNHTV
ncbi:MAG: hypothetical protein KBD47_01280 [Candidatus Pacebacteria bacterium]|jgi:hypothetical protein|nr:hypothetical protein [Candidatus Paceibacterota bacterium]